MEKDPDARNLRWGQGAGEDGSRGQDVAAVVNTIRILLMCGGRPHLGGWPVALGEGTLIISELEKKKKNGTQSKKTLFCGFFFVPEFN